MPYISGFDRDQLMCCSWDEFVEKESIARIIDAFVNSLDISRYGVWYYVKKKYNLNMNFLLFVIQLSIPSFLAFSDIPPQIHLVINSHNDYVFLLCYKMFLYIEKQVYMHGYNQIF